MDSSYSNAFLLVLTPSQECVGVRIFPNAYECNGITYRTYLHNCMTRANELKSKIESGEINTHSNILLNPPIVPQDLSAMKGLHIGYLKYKKHIKVENTVICLTRQLICTVQRDIVRSDVFSVLIPELIDIFSKDLLTPLMLKKHPKIVHTIEALTRYANRNVKSKRVQADSLKIQKYAFTLLRLIQKKFNFAGESYEFMDWFNNLVAFFNELIDKLSATEKLHLIDDPMDAISGVTFGDNSIVIRID